MVDDKVELLRRVPLFATLEPPELAQVARIANVVDVPAGTVLTHEGRHEGHFFVVVAGSVRIDQAGVGVNRWATETSWARSRSSMAALGRRRPRRSAIVGCCR
jgi:hypothetical protein